jgi:hypothetical protein
MKTIFDVEIKEADAKLTREWLRLPAGKVFFAYIEEAIKRHHGGVVSTLSDNPMKDVLATQREVGAELALVQLMEAVEFELSADADS